MLNYYAANNGWLENCQKLVSPNCNERPLNTDISLLVVHNISLPPGQFGTAFVEALFTNKLNVDDHPYFAEVAHLKVSAHLFINRRGEVLQFVSFDQRAWHAGQSCFLDRENCNDFSIGIELEGTDTEPYTEKQYAALAQVTGLLMSLYPKITLDRIVGHSDIAPTRKTDPGPAFDWVHFKDLLKPQA